MTVPARRRAPRARPAVPITPAMLEGAPEFAPVPRGAVRFDGWTPDRQRAFVKALAETGSIRRAACAVGMSEVGAYQIRKAAGSEAFAAAWAEALRIGVARLADTALDRALRGVPEPVFYKGEQVGERRRYNDRLLMWVLRHHDAETYAGPIGNRVPPHVRKALYAQWEAERAAAAREAGEATVSRLHATLEFMRRRLQDEGRLPPDLEGSAAAQMSLAERYVILSHHYAEMESDADGERD